MSIATDKPPKQGEIVRVRSRRYLVEAVEPAPRPEDQTLVRLSCLEDDAEGEELEVLWEKEVDAQRVSEADWSRLAQGYFDLPRHFAAYYRTLRWNTVTSTDPKLFQAPYRAGIRIDAYQLEPLRKALLLPRVNLFIADDVDRLPTVNSGDSGQFTSDLSPAFNVPPPDEFTQQVQQAHPCTHGEVVIDLSMRAPRPRREWR
jgi:hypothetical protein